MSKDVGDAVLLAWTTVACGVFIWLSVVFYGWQTRCPKCRKPRGRQVDGFVQTGTYEQTGYRYEQAVNRNLWGVAQGYTSYRVPYTIPCVSGYFACSCRHCKYSWNKAASGQAGRVRPPEVAGIWSLFFAGVLAFALWFVVLGALLPLTDRPSAATGGRGGAFASTGSQPRAARETVHFDARCRVRAEPAMDAKVVGSAPAGAKLRVLEVRDDYWYRVRVGGVVGWVGCRPGPVGG